MALLTCQCRPPSSLYSRKPIVVLPTAPALPEDVEKGEIFDHSLDRHVNDVLKHPSKIRRTMMGIWSFLKTRKCGVLYLYINYSSQSFAAMGVCQPKSFRASVF